MPVTVIFTFWLCLAFHWQPQMQQKEPFQWQREPCREWPAENHGELDLQVQGDTCIAFPAQHTVSTNQTLSCLSKCISCPFYWFLYRLQSTHHIFEKKMLSHFSPDSNGEHVKKMLPLEPTNQHEQTLKNNREAILVRLQQANRIQRNVWR